MKAVFTATRSGGSAVHGARGLRSLAAMTLAVGAATCAQVAPAVAAPIYGQGNAPSFAPVGNYDAGAELTRDVAVGDLNNDGKPDLATVSQSAGLGVQLGTGGGSFGAATHYAAPTGNFESRTFVVSVVIANLNGDGNLDVVSQEARAAVALVWLGTGDGAFAAAAKVELNPYPDCGSSNTTPCFADFPLDVTVGDFNEDGKPDIVTANGSSRNVAIVLGNGDGTFGAATDFGLNGGDLPLSVVNGDVNKDGHLDIVTANDGSSTISVLLGDGHGGFGTATNLNPGFILPSFVKLGDVNEDGNLDIVAGNDGFESNASVMDGDGAGGFGAPRVFAIGQNPSTIVVADINGDGHLDLVAPTRGDNNVAVYSGDGGGTFAAPVTFGLDGAEGPDGAAVADLNGDGRLDVVTANIDVIGESAAKSLSVLLNTTPPPTPATADLTARVPAYLSLSGGSADFGSIPPTADLASYYATAQLDVRTTYSGVEVSVGTASSNVDMGGLGEVQVTPWYYAGTLSFELFQNIPRPVFTSDGPANQLVPVSYRLQVQGRTALAKGHAYSEPIVYTATSSLP